MLYDTQILLDEASISLETVDENFEHGGDGDQKERGWDFTQLRMCTVK